MNKLIIGLLIIAAGAGAYFLLKNKKNTTETVSINKEFIIGKWKTEKDHAVKDSLQPNYQYEFKNDRIALRSISDTTKADTLKYEWGKTSQLVLKGNTADSTIKTYIVEKLTKDSLQFMSEDSIVTLLTRLK